MKDIGMFSITIKRLNEFNKREHNKYDLILEDKLIDDLLLSMVGEINPGIKGRLVVALRHLVSFIKDIRVVNYNNKYYIVKNGQEGKIYNNKVQDIAEYLVLDDYSIGIKVAESFHHHDFATNVMDVTNNRKNSMIGTVMSFDKTGLEVHRCVTEVAKPNSPVQFERTETYDRDEEVKHIVHVTRNATNYTDSFDASDRFDLTDVHYPDMDFSSSTFERIMKPTILSKVIK